MQRVNLGEGRTLVPEMLPVDATIAGGIADVMRNDDRPLGAGPLAQGRQIGSVLQGEIGPRGVDVVVAVLQRVPFVARKGEEPAGLAGYRLPGQ
jgi:hypothetical protein